jgi:ferredoxin-NADP reductase
MKISSLGKILKSYEIELIERKQEADQIYTFKFAIPDNLTWLPGSNGIFSFIDPEIRHNIHGKKQRIFSISSIPEEKSILIETYIKKEPSDFKKAMLKMEPGDLMRLRGPFGWINKLEPNVPKALLAGGVGIAPLRAILMDIRQKNMIGHVDLLYYSHNSRFTYTDLINEMEHTMPNLTVHLAHDREDFSIYLNRFMELYENSAKYYITGGDTTSHSLEKRLRDYGIKKQNIFVEAFYGYR